VIQVDGAVEDAVDEFQRDRQLLPVPVQLTGDPGTTDPQAARMRGDAGAAGQDVEQEVGGDLPLRPPARAAGLIAARLVAGGRSEPDDRSGLGPGQDGRRNLVDVGQLRSCRDVMVLGSGKASSSSGRVCQPAQSWFRVTCPSSNERITADGW